MTAPPHPSPSARTPPDDPPVPRLRAYATVLTLFTLVGGSHLIGAACDFAALSGADLPKWPDDLAEAVGLCLAGSWLFWLLHNRPEPAAHRVRNAAATTAILGMIAADEAGLLTSGGTSTGVVGHLTELLLWGWLAVEAAARCGVTPRQLGLVVYRRGGARSAAQRATGNTVGYTYAAILIVAMWGWALLKMLPGPVLRTSQAEAAGLHTLESLMAHALWSAAVEELLITGVVVAVLTTARRPLWECITVSVLMRMLPHAYAGLPMLAVIPIGIAAAWFYHRYQRVIPLILAHAGYNIILLTLPDPKPFVLDLFMVSACLALAILAWMQMDGRPLARGQAHGPAGP